MCFTDDGDYDWYVGEETRSIVPVTAPVKCHECRREITGEFAVKVHQIEDPESRSDDDFDEDWNLRPEAEPLEEWTGIVCGECDLTRFRIHLHELEEGCHESESWCPYGELRDYCCETDFEQSSREDGAKWINSKLGNAALA